MFMDLSLYCTTFRKWLVCIMEHENNEREMRERSGFIFSERKIDSLISSKSEEREHRQIYRKRKKTQHRAEIGRQTDLKEKERQKYRPRERSIKPPINFKHTSSE